MLWFLTVFYQRYYDTCFIRVFYHCLAPGVWPATRSDPFLKLLKITVCPGSDITIVFLAKIAPGSGGQTLKRCFLTRVMIFWWPNSFHQNASMINFLINIIGDLFHMFRKKCFILILRARRDAALSLARGVFEFFNGKSRKIDQTFISN